MVVLNLLDFFSFLFFYSFFMSSSRRDSVISKSPWFGSTKSTSSKAHVTVNDSDDSFMNKHYQQQQLEQYNISNESYTNNDDRVEMSSVTNPPSVLSTQTMLPPSPSIVSNWIKTERSTSPRRLIDRPLYRPFSSLSKVKDKEQEQEHLMISSSSSEAPLNRPRRNNKALQTSFTSMTGGGPSSFDSSPLLTTKITTAVKGSRVTEQCGNKTTSNPFIAQQKRIQENVHQQPITISTSATQLNLPPQLSSNEQVASQGLLRPRSVAATSGRARSIAGRPITAGGHRDHRIMVLAEGRGVASEVGVCIVHITIGECILSQVHLEYKYYMDKGVVIRLVYLSCKLMSHLIITKNILYVSIGF